MIPLIKNLRNWNARESIQRRVEARGLSLHLIYQDMIKDGCDVGGLWEDIRLYWNERAREFICNAGRVDISSRFFEGDVGYRSGFMDKIHESSDFPKEFNLAYAHPAESSISRASSKNEKNRLLVRGRILEEKRSFINKFNNCDGEHFDGALKFNNISDFFLLSLGNYGFDVNRNMAKKTKGHIIMTVRLEKPSANRLPMFQLPVVASIFHESQKEYKFEISNFDILVPGCSYINPIKDSLDVDYGLSFLSAIITSLFESI